MQGSSGTDRHWTCKGCNICFVFLKQGWKPQGLSPWQPSHDIFRSPSFTETNALFWRTAHFQLAAKYQPIQVFLIIINLKLRWKVFKCHRAPELVKIWKPPPWPQMNCPPPPTAQLNLMASFTLEVPAHVLCWKSHLLSEGILWSFPLLLKAHRVVRKRQELRLNPKMTFFSFWFHKLLWEKIALPRPLSWQIVKYESAPWG